MCWRCDNPWATDADDRARLVAMVDKYRWMVRFIEPSPTSPPWAYTVGLTAFDRPELVVMGMPMNPVHRLLNGLAEMVIDGTAPQPGSHLRFTNGLHLEWVRLSQPTAHLHSATDLFGQRIRAMQAVHADDRGRWPWDARYRDGRGGQPVLGPRTVL
jgi:hypothetical protein